MRDLLEHKEKLTVKDLHTLKLGRHFRYHGSKVVVSRSEAENHGIKSLVQPGDTLVEPADFPGPVALVAGMDANGAVEMAGRLVLRYASKAGREAALNVTRDGVTRTVTVSAPADEATIEETRVC